MNKLKTSRTNKSKDEILSLSSELLEQMYRKMVLIRKFEETVYDIYGRGIMPGLAHLYIGMEAVAVGVCLTLQRKDNITSTHRGHGHLLAKGGDPKRMFAELLGKRSGYNRGKGGSMHIVDTSLGILGANGIVGGGLGIAVGAALSSEMLKDGRVSVAFFGDGALNEGLFYETANMASLWKLPVIFVMENNLYGQYTRTGKATAGTATARAEAMEIAATSVDGNDIISVYKAASWAMDRARSGDGPSFLECMTYRLRGHHMGDQGDTYGYRTPEEVDEFRKLDPIPRLKMKLTENKVFDELYLENIESKIQEIINEAIEFALEDSYPDPSEVYESVYV
jgi:TPP-dependent pyruvate/acetoin dehydrogenase alpha subunit